MNHPNIFNNNSNKEIAQIIYDEFVKDNNLSKNNVRKKIDILEDPEHFEKYRSIWREYRLRLGQYFLIYNI